MIRAAGGLVVRGDSPSAAEVAVVHRPRYDDWSIPKGKHDPGESSPTCAVREVWEETGYRCRIVGPAGTTRYRVGDEVKEVDYYLMRPYRSLGFRPDREVDAMRWVSPGEAAQLLTYHFDRELVTTLDLDPVLSQTTIHLIRHGPAGDRSRWEGPDEQRPLTPEGRSQAKTLADELGDVGLIRVLSSPYLRCVQTVEPLGERLGREVEEVDELAEEATPDQIWRVLEEVGAATVALCSHGDVIPAMLQRLQWMGVRFLHPLECDKGSTWVIAHDGSAYREARYLPPPCG